MVRTKRQTFGICGKKFKDFKSEYFKIIVFVVSRKCFFQTYMVGLGELTPLGMGFLHLEKFFL